MAVLAVSAAWVGVVGTIAGGLLGVMATLMLHRSERAERIAERSRAERKEAYAALLTYAEDSFHLFERIAEGQFSRAGSQEDDLDKADKFYDDAVTPRYMVQKIIGEEAVLPAAKELRDSLNSVRHFMIDSRPLPTKKSLNFQRLHSRYRRARDQFIAHARSGLDLRHEQQGKRTVLGRWKGTVFR
jgi:hypothetical protein